ncbi:hypothetical protein [Pedobacter frigidisoli]|uniref:hypothetical protein n=1 Tax=Pedobacter frigidisoli TaxID=2530455 RepID=UPI00292E3EED|nr:hypothetical protein [Pedobacter frigidisoli]
MELDDLKQDWTFSSQKYKAPTYKLGELISQKGNGSLGKLKAKYKKQMILLPLVAAFLTVAMIVKPVLQQSAFIWFIIPVALTLALMYYRDYKLIEKMEDANTESVKSSIQKNMHLLRQNARHHLIFARIFLAAFIIILEATMYFQPGNDFAFWQTIALPLRLIIYGVAGFLQPYITKYFFDYHFGKYIKDLQALSEQTT